MIAAAFFLLLYKALHTGVTYEHRFFCPFQLTDRPRDLGTMRHAVMEYDTCWNDPRMSGRWTSQARLSQPFPPRSCNRSCNRFQPAPAADFIYTIPPGRSTSPNTVHHRERKLLDIHRHSASMSFPASGVTTDHLWLMGRRAPMWHCYRAFWASRN